MSGSGEGRRARRQRGSRCAGRGWANQVAAVVRTGVDTGRGRGVEVEAAQGEKRMPLLPDANSQKSAPYYID